MAVYGGAIGLLLLMWLAKYLRKKNWEKIAKMTGKEVPKEEKKQVKEVQKEKDVIKQVKKWAMAIGAIGFILTLIAYSREARLLAIMAVLGAMSAGSLALPIGVLLGNKKIICKILRLLSGKNYGIVRLMNGSIEEKEKIKNMDNDILNIGDNVFIIQAGRLYQAGADDDLGVPIKESQIKLSSGIPILYLDKKSITPLTFFKDENSMSPEMVSAVLKADATNREAELLSVKKKQGQKLLLLLILGVVAAWFSFKGYSGQSEMIATFKAVCGDIAGKINIPAGANVVNQVP